MHKADLELVFVQKLDSVYWRVGVPVRKGIPEGFDGIRVAEEG